MIYIYIFIHLIYLRTFPILKLSKIDRFKKDILTQDKIYFVHGSCLEVRPLLVLITFLEPHTRCVTHHSFLKSSKRFQKMTRMLVTVSQSRSASVFTARLQMLPPMCVFIDLFIVLVYLCYDQTREVNLWLL